MLPRVNTEYLRKLIIRMQKEEHIDVSDLTQNIKEGSPKAVFAIPAAVSDFNDKAYKGTRTITHRTHSDNRTYSHELIIQIDGKTAQEGIRITAFQVIANLMRTVWYVSEGDAEKAKDALEVLMCEPSVYDTLLKKTLEPFDCDLERSSLSVLWDDATGSVSYHLTIGLPDKSHFDFRSASWDWRQTGYGDRKAKLKVVKRDRTPSLTRHIPEPNRSNTPSGYLAALEAYGSGLTLTNPKSHTSLDADMISKMSPRIPVGRLELAELQVGSNSGPYIAEYLPMPDLGKRLKRVLTAMTGDAPVLDKNNSTAFLIIAQSIAIDVLRVAPEDVTLIVAKNNILCFSVKNQYMQLDFHLDYPATLSTEDILSSNWS